MIRLKCHIQFVFLHFKDQCKTAGIIPWNNNWGNIHDFTPMSEGKNYSLLDQNEILSKYLPIPTDPSVSHLNIDDSQENSVTPFTYGELFQNRNDEVKIRRKKRKNSNENFRFSAMFRRSFSR
jgi:hypothetical protein